MKWSTVKRLWGSPRNTSAMRSDFTLVFSTAQPLNELRARLGAECVGLWELSRLWRPSSKGLRRYRISFERTDDARILLGPQVIFDKRE